MDRLKKEVEGLKVKVKTLKHDEERLARQLRACHSDSSSVRVLGILITCAKALHQYSWL